MKKVLVIYQSQTGQLKRVVESFVSKLADEEIQVHVRAIEPIEKLPYPSTFYQFADEFPEAVHMDGCEIKEVEFLDDNYDLIIVGYTIWFLSPSSPIVGFLKSEQAKKLFYDTPVVTLIACRDMWIMAQEKMKVLLEKLNAKLIDNVVLTDQGKGIYSFVTTPRWLLTGKKDAFWFFPKAGISQNDIDEASRFGIRLNEALKNDEQKSGKPLLKNLNAVSVDGKLVAAEKIATRSANIWAKLIKLCGDKKTLGRKIAMTFYSAFLVILVFTVVPISIIVRKIVNSFQEEKLKKIAKKYEEPSGR